MGIIDELDTAVEYKGAKKREEEYRPSSYNPLISYPENLWEEAKGAGRQIYQGAQELGQGHIGGGAFDVGMGALRGVASPAEAGIRSATFPLSDVTGIPEPYLDIGANLAIFGPGAVRQVGKTARRFMGIGGEAAPAAEAAGAVEPRIGATNRPEWERASEGRKQAYYEGVAGRRGAQMEEAAGRTPPVSPAERFFPSEGPKLLTHGGADTTVHRMPNEAYPPMRETYAQGYRPGEPQRQIEYKPTPPPAIAMPDYTAEKFMGLASKRSGEMKSEREAFREAIPQMDYGTRPPRDITRPMPPEPMDTPLSREEKFGRLGELAPERRLFGAQAPTQEGVGWAGRAAGRAGEMKAEREASRIPNEPATRTRNIRRSQEEVSPRSMSKEEKLKTVESEGVRSLYDAVRTLEATGMEASEAEKHILDAVRRGYMTAVKASGAPLTAKEAKRLRSLKGLGGVSWTRG